MKVRGDSLFEQRRGSVLHVQGVDLVFYGDSITGRQVCLASTCRPGRLRDSLSLHKRVHGARHCGACAGCFSSAGDGLVCARKQRGVPLRREDAR